MKTKIIVALIALTVSVKAQVKDTALVNLQNQVQNIKLNLMHCHDEYVVGVALHGTDLMVGIITLTGVQQKMFNNRQMYTGFLIQGVFHAVGATMQILSHRYLGKAAMNISPTSITFKW